MLLPTRTVVLVLTRSALPFKLALQASTPQALRLSLSPSPLLSRELPSELPMPEERLLASFHLTALEI